MHWEWKNCPSGWKGMFQGKLGVPSVVLEAIADNCCQFWHLNFGSAGALNDLNILDCSPLFDNAVCGESPSVNFVVNRNAYQYAYWLDDGIYPRYAWLGCKKCLHWHRRQTGRTLNKRLEYSRHNSISWPLLVIFGNVTRWRQPNRCVWFFTILWLTSNIRME